MRIWFYVGDCIDWFSSHRRVSGIIRVTQELLSAALKQEEPSTPGVVPCVLVGAAGDLAAVDPVQTLCYFAVGEDDGAAKKPKPSLCSPRHSPKRGDFVLFTGVVWTPGYVDLFRRLRRKGVEFGVLVYDIIPIERPDFVSDDYQRMFGDWLKVVATTARIIFVSSQITKDQILRWAILAGADMTAEIVPVTFGAIVLGQPLRVNELARNATTNCVNFNSFVLSVGTIDRRKNQASLCKTWRRLIADLGASRVPQLVLAGRNDLKSREFDADTADAMEKSQIVILEDLSDRELAGLYGTCRFTVFPSLVEGYGLPVAESLDHGKLCIASSLPVIKEHAGDLAWYFDPTIESAAYNRIRHAIERPELRLAVEQEIGRRYSRLSWASTLQTMVQAIKAVIAPSD